MNMDKYIEAEHYYDMACEWIPQKNYEKAEEYLLRVIECNPNFIYAYITLSQVYGRRKKFHDAIRILKKVAHIDPSFDKIYYLMALFAYQNENLKQALLYIEEALAYNPSTRNERVKKMIQKRHRELTG